LTDFIAIEENGWLIYGYSKKHKKIRILKINNSLFKEEVNLQQYLINGIGFLENLNDKFFMVADHKTFNILIFEIDPYFKPHII
jgi:hypothetical protein